LTIGLTIAMHYDILNCIWAGDNRKLAGEVIKMQDFEATSPLIITVIAACHASHILAVLARVV